MEKYLFKYTMSIHYDDTYNANYFKELYINNYSTSFYLLFF